MEKKIQKNDNDILWRVENIRVERDSCCFSDADTFHYEVNIMGIPNHAKFIPRSLHVIGGELNRLLGNSDISKPKIDKVVYNNPATIILWKDGSKTVVKCQDGDTYDEETGFVMAYLKKMLGNDNTFNKEITKHVPVKEKEVPKQTQEDVKDQDYYKLQQERAKLMRILDFPRMTKKHMAELISEVVDGIDNIVMGKEEPKKRDTDFKVGDLVRIRSWDDMAKEFGYGCDGSIACMCSFTPDMKNLCGKAFVIEGINTTFNHVYGLDTGYYFISTDMIEKVNK